MLMDLRFVYLQARLSSQACSSSSRTCRGTRTRLGTYRICSRSRRNSPRSRSRRRSRTFHLSRRCRTLFLPRRTRSSFYHYRRHLRPLGIDSRGRSTFACSSRCWRRMGRLDRRFPILDRARPFVQARGRRSPSSQRHLDCWTPRSYPHSRTIHHRIFLPICSCSLFSSSRSTTGSRQVPRRWTPWSSSTRQASSTRSRRSPRCWIRSS